MHYGMTIVVMNVLGQVLSVKTFKDESGIESFEIQCKNPELLAEEDRFCFKLLDLAEPLNPGPIKYGAPLWLQLEDSAGGSESSWLQGSVLGAQLFGPPEMKSIQSGQELLGHSSSSSSGKSNTDSSSKLDVNTLMSSSSNSPELIRQRSGRIDEEERPGSRSPSKTRKTPNKDKSGGDSSTKKKMVEMANICGGMKVVKIADSSKHSGESSMTSSTTIKDEKKLRSKQAWQLGQFVAHFALRTPDTVDAGFVNSQSPLVLEQDLYCMATSQLSGYRPWPKKGKDIMKDISHNAQTRPSSAKNLNSLAAGQSGEESTLAGGIDFACMRKFDIRGPPYEHIVDRRCVWRFCAVESSSDFKSMSVKEQRAQKLLKQAKVTLDNSKKNRTGGRQYKGVVVNGQPLVGGERFPRMLRESTAAATLKSETELLHKRRLKEENLGTHLQTLFMNSLGTVSELFSDEEFSVSGEEESSEPSSPKPGTDDSRPFQGEMVPRRVSFQRQESGSLLGVSSGSPSLSGSFSPDSRLGGGSCGKQLLGSPIGGHAHSGRARTGHGHRHHHHGHSRRNSPDSRGSGTSGREDDDLGLHEAHPDRGHHSYGDDLMSIHKGFAETNMYTRSQLTSTRQRITDIAPTRGQEGAGAAISAKIASRIETLIQMDDLMQQALKHRSRIDKRRTNIREDSTVGDDTVGLSQQTERE